MANHTIYTVGGTVQAGGGIYIPRKADEELLGYCRAGEFAFILSSRQVGKSSLMVRTSQQLEKEGIRSVIIDLSSIGVNISADEWYLGILNEITNTLKLRTDIFAWWEERADLSPATRLTNFFHYVLLREVTEPVVLFFDEIDSTLSIPFADDFFAALRAIYNARSTVPEFKRLSFVMIGVATPGQLIADNKRTPFNIGHRVDLTDFTFEEALPLVGKLDKQVLRWILAWTGGHPYLTQRLCAQLSKSETEFTEETVADAVKSLFEGDQGWQDNNLQFVRDMLIKRSPNLSRVLKTYKDIRTGKKVTDDERSIAKAHLKISGIVRSKNGFLQPRNQIYENVFNVNWTQENIPKNWQKVALISLSTAFVILVFGILTIFINDSLVGMRISAHVGDFINATTPAQRLSNLAGIYQEKGILLYKDSNLTASQLFYGLSSAEDQLALFNPYEINQRPDLQDDLVDVVSGLYVTAANVDPKEDNTELLQVMHDSLSNVQDKKNIGDLQNEIAAWLDGRKKASDKDYKGALASYDIAFSLGKGKNHAVLYERAKVNIDQEKYANALQDLDAAIGLAKQSLPEDNEGTPEASSLPTLLPTTTTPKLLEALTKTPSGTPSSRPTITPSGVGLTPTRVTPTMATLVLTPSPTPAPLVLTPSPTPVPLPTQVRIAKFESNFINLIDVINAVRTLIEKIPQQFRNVVQSNPDNTYANLQLYSFVVITSPTPVVVPSSTLFFTKASSPIITPRETLTTTAIPTETVEPTATPLVVLAYGKLVASYFKPYDEPNQLLLDVVLQRNQLLAILSIKEQGVKWYECAWEIDGVTGHGWILADRIKIVESPTPSISASLTMTPTETVISTAAPAESTLIPLETPISLPSPLEYSPIVVFDDQLLAPEYKLCWTNEVDPSSRLVEPEGFNRKIDNTWWVFNTGDGRTIEESVRTDFGTCPKPLPDTVIQAGQVVNVIPLTQSVNAIALNTWVTQIRPESGSTPGGEFGLYLQATDGTIREYTLWVDQSDTLHLRIREDSKIVYDDTVLVANIQSSGRGNIYRQFRVQIFLEVDNDGSTVLYLLEADPSSASAQDLKPNQMVRIDAATLPTMGDLQGFGLVGRGGSTLVNIWPLALLGK